MRIDVPCHCGSGCQCKSHRGANNLKFHYAFLRSVAVVCRNCASQERFDPVVEEDTNNPELNQRTSAQTDHAKGAAFSSAGSGLSGCAWTCCSQQQPTHRLRFGTHHVSVTREKAGSFREQDDTRGRWNSGTQGREPESSRRSAQQGQALGVTARQAQTGRTSRRGRAARGRGRDRFSRRGMRISRHHRLSVTRPAESGAVLADASGAAAELRGDEGHRRGQVAVARCRGQTPELSPGKAVPEQCRPSCCSKAQIASSAQGEAVVLKAKPASLPSSARLRRDEIWLNRDRALAP